MSKSGKDRMIGVGVTFFTMMISFLAYNFSGSFVTRAAYNKDMAIIQVIMVHLKRIEDKVDNIYKNTKTILKE